MQSARQIKEGVSILNETLLIPFKARAYLDLSKRSVDGEAGLSGKIKKHCKDVFRLAQLLRGDAIVPLAAPIKADLQAFVEEMANERVDTKQMRLAITQEDALDLIGRVYEL